MMLNDFMLTAKTRLTRVLNTYLDAKQPAAKLKEAIAYAVYNGGKHIRPLLVYLTGRALNASWENLDAPAAAIELIHAYSLIHDDLPAMDNAALRRGKATCHKAFDEATAILAGDALQPLASEILANHPCDLSPKQRLAMIHTLSRASGIQGMTAGQALDLEGMTSLASLTRMYQLKTGALLAASVKLGTIAADKEDINTNRALHQFAESLGLAFQIQDDVLDIAGQNTGKPQGIDQINQKLTYPSLIGIEQSKQHVQTLFTRALDSIEFLQEQGTLLYEFAHSLLKRKK